jgi:hypothetical protein
MLVILMADRYFSLLVPAEPPTVIVRLVHGDSINPGSEAAPLAKRIHAAKDFQKYLLNDIAGVALIA